MEDRVVLFLSYRLELKLDQKLKADLSQALNSKVLPCMKANPSAGTKAHRDTLDKNSQHIYSYFKDKGK